MKAYIITTRVSNYPSIKLWEFVFHTKADAEKTLGWIVEKEKAVSKAYEIFWKEKQSDLKINRQVIEIDLPKDFLTD